MDERPVVRNIEEVDIDISGSIPCRATDPDLWFAEAPSDLEHAKQLCEGCPLQRACLAAALERGEPWGVWGGQIFDQGVVIARKRPRGRPRKNAA
ncbi:WhiB family transcriptional regulator [Tsukamurella sp. 1534]|uniref:WhiB family transcriptional regulator n=1 Tax=Tsukamurella sp. 1534 TaxID=1151061 RepID=UPI000684901E|nr:WhiB family transcriptional regulator [Tsukamurella sp. 1534]